MIIWTPASHILQTDVRLLEPLLPPPIYTTFIEGFDVGSPLQPSKMLAGLKESLAQAEKRLAGHYVVRGTSTGWHPYHFDYEERMRIEPCLALCGPAHPFQDTVQLCEVYLHGKWQPGATARVTLHNYARDAKNPTKSQKETTWDAVFILKDPPGLNAIFESTPSFYVSSPHASRLLVDGSSAPCHNAKHSLETSCFTLQDANWVNIGPGDIDTETVFAAKPHPVLVRVLPQWLQHYHVTLPAHYRAFIGAVSRHVIFMRSQPLSYPSLKLWEWEKDAQPEQS